MGVQEGAAQFLQKVDSSIATSRNFTFFGIWCTVYQLGARATLIILERPFLVFIPHHFLKVSEEVLSKKYLGAGNLLFQHTYFFFVLKNGP